MPATTSLLIAHPKELIRAGLYAMLEGTRITIVGEAPDATSTLTLAKKHKPAVVLLDVAIPGGDAFELAGTLSKSLPGTALVFMTALDNPTYMARARAVGAVHCFLKDFSQKELVAVIENAAAGKPASGSGKFGRVTASLASREKGPALDAGLTLSFGASKAATHRRPKTGHRVGGIGRKNPLVRTLVQVAGVSS